MIVALPGLFSYLFFLTFGETLTSSCDSYVAVLFCAPMILFVAFVVSLFVSLSPSFVPRRAALHDFGIP